MLTQRTMQTTLRRLAAQRSPLLSQARMSGTLSPGETGTKPGVAGAATPQLIEQRLRRPVAPHLGIYQPQITWYASSLNRITGCVLSGGFYVFGFGYLVSPMFGIHAFESASLISAFAGLGAASKFSLKFLLAFPFTFHSFNGLRHLMWDTGAGFTNKQVIATGWTVVAISIASAAGLAMIGGGAA